MVSLNKMFDSRFQFNLLSHTEQAELLGEVIKFGSKDYLVVELDEFTARLFYGESYTLLTVFPVIKTELSVLLSSVDNAYFRASADNNLSTLTEKIYDWARRTNCKYINRHALEDYCEYLGAYYVDYS
jgi:hypothetical protein